ncbi:cuticle protein LPCP-23-like [Contarinia nasturtii]|uniref:cuticle protein LPCP-23-like n=1 Tax=Contarinia nasturtii TaxID=265458 RepID=UPI0012D4BA65|nr:cuticle protein LPCP-23-like [Contarinia nasturtii]
MAFELITIFCATLALAHAGLLAQPAYSAAPAVSHVYSSIGSYSQPAVLAQAAPAVYSAPAIARIANPVIAAPAAVAVAPALRSYAAPLLQAPIAKIAYSPASEVSHVYSSIAAPQYAYGAQAPIAIHSPAIGSSQQSTIRSLGGTISTYAKAVDTAFSSVRKSDTRISNNVYTPSYATKTIAVQQPAIIEQKSIPATVVSHVQFDGIGAHYGW